MWDTHDYWNGQPVIPAPNPAAESVTSHKEWTWADAHDLHTKLTPPHQLAAVEPQDIPAEWFNDLHGMLVSENDAVNHPTHYTSHPSGIECIQVTEHMGFNLGNAVKYLWRADLKHDTPLEDLEKAVWYINREIARRA